MGKKKIIIITSSVFFSLIILITLPFAIYFGVRLTRDFKMNGYSYFKIQNEDDQIWDMNPILFYEGTHTTSKLIPGVSMDDLNVSTGSKTKWSDKDLYYGEPVYEDNILTGYFGSDSRFTDSHKTIYTDFEGSEEPISDKLGSHEYYINQDFALFAGSERENNFHYVDLDNKETITFDFLDIFEFPPIEQVFMTGWDFTHFNSFDIWKDNLIINSRNLSTIFSIKLFNNGEILDPDEIVLNWVLPSDPTALYYIGNNDLGGNTPLVKMNPGDSESKKLKKNENYKEELFETYKGKIINPYVNDKEYDLSNPEEAKDYGINVDHKNKFFGQHKVSVLNQLFKDHSDIINVDYNDDLIYLSIFDNHWPGSENNTNGTPNVIKPSLYTTWSDQYEDWKNDKRVSYTKILAINPTENEIQGIPSLSYKNLLNHDNSMLTKNDMFSTIISSSLFFTINDENYLSITDGKGKTTVLLSFDYIDVETQSLVNPSMIYEIHLGLMNTEAYRAYPIFNDISNVDYGWNLTNYNDGKFN